MVTAIIALLLPLLLFACCTTANVIEVGPDGIQHEVHGEVRQQPPRSVKATFVNALPATECNLYWVGNSNNNAQTGGGTGGGAPRLFYGPIPPKGGERSVEGFAGQVFALTKAGTYERLGEYTISSVGTTTGSSNAAEQRFTLTEEDAAHSRNKFPPKAEASASRERVAASCRSAKASSCGECADLGGCGWSIVRQSCYALHPVATVKDVAECKELDSMAAAGTKSVDAWLNRATALVLGNDAKYGYGPQSLRAAYRVLERAMEAAAADMEAQAKANDAAKRTATLAAKKASGMLSELSAKLEAVFDDQDAAELLALSRHPALAAIHPTMSAVDRRTMSEAREYIVRGEPVVITDVFADADEMTSPVAHKWTLEYLSRRVFGPAATSTRNEGGTATADDSAAEEVPRFNVAADVASRCCRYFEPQGKAQKAGYPYPFAPSTHLYRDTFDGFVKTVRKASRMNYSNDNKAPSSKRVLHYLHEIVMNEEGEAVVAGGPAPTQLVDDLDAVTATLRPIASDQPFFGDFANAKVWLGQRGIVMPNHYDATDNLYVMAWGRKRAIIGEPGQLDALYRYPNEHPLAGSSQVNLTAPDLSRYPRFKDARLREVVVGPGDVLYLPSWWWHQFEQPFEDTAALNLWSRDRDQVPDASMRDMRIREHTLADQLERSVVQLLGSEAGVVLEALANNRVDTLLDEEKLKRAKETLRAAAEEWRHGVVQLPGGHSKTAQSAAELVKEHLELTHREVMQEANWSDWHPGIGWDLSQTAKLPRELRERCEPAPESSPFTSLCD